MENLKNIVDDNVAEELDELADISIDDLDEETDLNNYWIGVFNDHVYI